MIRFETIDVNGELSSRCTHFDNDIRFSFELDDSVGSRELRSEFGISGSKVVIFQEHQLISNETVGLSFPVMVLLSSKCGVLVISLCHFSCFL